MKTKALFLTIVLMGLCVVSSAQTQLESALRKSADSVKTKSVILH